jgi:excisionase family DNA binding protein
MNTGESQTEHSDEFVGLGEAAQVLGLSRTSVQKLVDLGHVEAVRTGGGHRRILRSSLMSYRQQMATQGPRTEPGRLPLMSRTARSQSFEVLLVDDDELTIEVLSTLLERHFPQFVRSVARDGMEAVVQIERQRPNVVITDLNMQPFDGFRLARHISGKPEYAGICVLAMTALSEEEVQRRGGLPPDVLVYRKPLKAERLIGFLEAHAQVQRKLRSAMPAPAVSSTQPAPLE